MNDPPAVWHPGATYATGGAHGPAVPGLVTGPVAFGSPTAPGQLLVVPDARSIHSQHFDTIAGLIVERGGPLSHLVLLAREHGLPTIVGPAPDVEPGTVMTLDGAKGTLTP